MELEDAVHTAILTLKEGMDGVMEADKIEGKISDDLFSWDLTESYES